MDCQWYILCMLCNVGLCGVADLSIDAHSARNLYSIIHQPCHSPQDQSHRIIDEGGSVHPNSVPLAPAHILRNQRLDSYVFVHFVVIRISRSFAAALVFVVRPIAECRSFGRVLDHKGNQSNASISDTVRSGGTLDAPESLEILDQIPLPLSLRIGVESIAK